jgi:hypothetical protein
MLAFFAALAFAIALLLDLLGVSRGHVDATTFMLAGLLLLALAVAVPEWRPWRRAA